MPRRPIYPAPSAPTGFRSHYSAQLDGVNKYLDLGNICDNDGLTPMTVSAWIKPSNVNGYFGVVSKYNDEANAGWNFQVAQGKIRFYFEATNDRGIDSQAGSIVANEWHHVVAVFTGSQMRVFVNGVLSNSASVSTEGGASNASSLVIGKVNHYNQYFPGLIGDVSVWPIALSDDEVFEVFNFGIEGDLSQHSRYNDFKDNERSLWATWEDPDDLTSRQFTLSWLDSEAVYISDSDADGMSPYHYAIKTSVTDGVDTWYCAVPVAAFDSPVPFPAGVVSITGRIPGTLPADNSEVPNNPNGSLSIRYQSDGMTLDTRYPRASSYPAYPIGSFQLAYCSGPAFPTIGVVHDRTENEYEGTPVNTVAGDRIEETALVLPTFTHGHSGVFNGVDEYVDFGDVADDSNTDSFSVVAWVKTTMPAHDNNVWGAIIAKGGYSTQGFSLIMRPQNPAYGLEWVGGGGYDFFPGDDGYHLVNLFDGKWHQVGFIINPASPFKFIVDGVIYAGVHNQILTSSENSHHLFVGASLNDGLFGPSYFNGEMGDISKWPFALSSNEIAELFHGGREFDLKQHSRYNDLKASARSLWITWEKPDSLE